MSKVIVVNETTSDKQAKRCVTHLTKLSVRAIYVISRGNLIDLKRRIFLERRGEEEDSNDFLFFFVKYVNCFLYENVDLLRGDDIRCYLSI